MILVAVGSNLPGPWGAQPLQTCRRAARALAGIPGLGVRDVSRWYRTAPVPRSTQPDYANGVVRLEGSADPAELLSQLQALERAAGRVRGAADAARTLDLDIIDMDGRIRGTPDPMLPHPRACERAFVLVPLRDVAPDWVDPASGRSLATLLSGLRESCNTDAEPLAWPTPYI